MINKEGDMQFNSKIESGSKEIAQWLEDDLSMWIGKCKL